MNEQPTHQAPAVRADAPQRREQPAVAARPAAEPNRQVESAGTTGLTTAFPMRISGKD